MTIEGARAFILANTKLERPPHVPEIELYLASEAHDLWHRTEEELAELGLPPPFWAFAWAGGQALARYILDHPDRVRGKKVLDFATGSGLVAIAAAKAGAAHILASDIDPFSQVTFQLNCQKNQVSAEFSSDDLIGTQGHWDIILAGDVFYDAEFAALLMPWFEMLAKSGVTILIGDPGRAYLPRHQLQRLAQYEVATSRALEDADVKRTNVWALSND